MKTLSKRTALLALLLVPLACSGRSDEGVVARAGDSTLSVDDVVRLITAAPELPPEASVVDAVANLWVDYTLLAQSIAQDSTLGTLDIDQLLVAQIEQDMILSLRDAVIAPDTALSEDELRTLFEEQNPGTRVRARHILLAIPEQATVTQRDSVRGEAESLLTRLRAGADFADLAQRFSTDRGSAANGGDLGFFERGDMVRPFEEAAFALQPGDLSDVVESPFGFHVIKVEERESPAFDLVRDRFRDEVIGQRFLVAESLYIAEMEAGADLQVDTSTTDIVRRIAADPTIELSRRAENRRLVSFSGGTVDVGDLRAFMATRPPEYRAQVARAPDEVIVDQLLGALAQRSMLVERAEAAGLRPEDSLLDSLRSEVRTQLMLAAEAAGVKNIEARGTETFDQAVERQVEESLRDMMNDRRAVVPLGALSPVLRADGRGVVYVPSIGVAVAELLRVIGPRAAPAPPAPPAEGDDANTQEADTEGS